MSTYLELCQFCRQECTDSGSGPTTVVGQTGELGRYVKWIKDAWQELQVSRPDWRWPRKSFYVPTVADTEAYAYNAAGLVDTVTVAAITRWSYWYRLTFKAYLQSDGVGTEYPLMWIEWDGFRRIYHYGTQNSQQPIHVSVDPTGKFTLGPKPNAVYIVSGDYQLATQILALDADVPDMPADYHNLIVFDAMAKYGGKNVAVEAMVRANSEGGRLRMALELNQLPPMLYGGSLA